MTPEDSISDLIVNLVDQWRAAEARAAKAEADALVAKSAYMGFYRKVQNYAVNHAISSSLAAIVVDDWGVFVAMHDHPDRE